MKKNITEEILIGLLVLLFVYAGSSKLLDMGRFREAMLSQVFPAWMNKALAVTIPFAEIITAILLLSDRTRSTALYAYGVLMFAFTVYTGLAVFGFFEKRPCGCGGIISGLGWTGHFILNMIFLIMTCLIPPLQQQ